MYYTSTSVDPLLLLLSGIIIGACFIILFLLDL